MTRELADRALELFKAQDEAALSALFDSAMQQSVTPEKIRDVWHRAEMASGALVASGEPVVAERPGGAENL